MTIFNELSAARNPNNMAMLGVMFNASSASQSGGGQLSTDSLAAASLASVFVDLMLQKDDYLRALRALLREIVRVLRYALRQELSIKTYTQRYTWMESL